MAGGKTFCLDEWTKCDKAASWSELTWRRCQRVSYIQLFKSVNILQMYKTKRTALIYWKKPDRLGYSNFPENIKRIWLSWKISISGKSWQSTQIPTDFPTRGNFTRVWNDNRASFMRQHTDVLWQCYLSLKLSSRSALIWYHKRRLSPCRKKS